MTVRIGIDDTSQSMDLSLEPGGKGPDPACQYVDNGILYMVFLDIAAAIRQGSHIIPDRLGRTNIGNFDFKASCFMVLELSPLPAFTCHMILKPWMILVILCQLVHKCLITSIGPRDPFTSYNKYMPHHFFSCRFLGFSDNRTAILSYGPSHSPTPLHHQLLCVILHAAF